MIFPILYSNKIKGRNVNIQNKNKTVGFHTVSEHFPAAILKSYPDWSISFFFLLLHSHLCVCVCVYIYIYINLHFLSISSASLLQIPHSQVLCFTPRWDLTNLILRTIPMWRASAASGGATGEPSAAQFLPPLSQRRMPNLTSRLLLLPPPRLPMPMTPMLKLPLIYVMILSPSIAFTLPATTTIPTLLMTLNFPSLPKELSRSNLPPSGPLFFAPLLPVLNRSLRSLNASPPLTAGPPLVGWTGPSLQPPTLSRGSSSLLPRLAVAKPPPVGLRLRRSSMNSPPPPMASSPPPCSESVLVSQSFDSVAHFQNRPAELLCFWYSVSDFILCSL